MINESQIAEIEIDYTNIENVEKPELVYKYRSWNIGETFSDNLLLKNQLYFAHPESFVDEHDCRILERYDLMTDDEIYQWCEIMIRREHPNWNDEGVARDVKHFAPIKIKEFRDKDQLYKFKVWEWNSYNALCGILSLCTEPLNTAMWEMYGDDNRGICYGFSTNDLIKECAVGGGGPVHYVTELPILHPFQSIIYRTSLRVYTKLEHWSFEQEYRMRTFEEANRTTRNRLRVFPDKVLKEVTLGADFDENEIPRIIDILVAKDFKPELYRCISEDNQLKRKVIEY